MLALLIAVLGFAVLSGMVMALGSIQLAILIVGIIIAPVVLLMPSTTLIASLLLLSTVIAGCLQYFLRVDQAHWLPAMLLAAMLARIPLDALRGSHAGQRLEGFTLLGSLILVFAAVVFVAALVNLSSVMQSLVGFKHYIFPLALIAAVVQAGAQREFWLQLWRAVPWLMLLQFPACLYQYLFVEKSRGSELVATGISWDAVVGTFGGNPDGGGASGVLALFLCFGLIAVLALRRAGLTSPGLAWWAFVAIAASMLLAEVKVVIVFLPLAVLVYQRKRVLKSALSAIAWSVATMAFVIALLMAYSVLHWQSKHSRPYEIEDTFNYVFKAESDARFYNRLTGEVSRGGALLLWSDENLVRNISVQTLIGNGPASSKVSTLFGQGSAARKYQFSLITSAASMMLWDLGLLGMLCFTSIVGVAFWRAISLCSQLKADPQSVAVAESVAAALVLIMAGLFYNNDAVNHPAVQSLLALSLGLVINMQRQINAAKRAPNRFSPGGRLASPLTEPAS